MFCILPAWWQSYFLSISLFSSLTLPLCHQVSTTRLTPRWWEEKQVLNGSWHQAEMCWQPTPPLNVSHEGWNLTMADAGQLGRNTFILKKRGKKGFKDPKVFLADISVINFFTRQNGQKMNAIKSQVFMLPNQQINSGETANWHVLFFLHSFLFFMC